MKNCKPIAYYAVRNMFFVTALFSAVSAQALETKELLPEGPSYVLLENKKPIYCETQGLVPVNFTQALKVFSHPDLMKNVQSAYTHHVLEEGDAEFSIQQTSTTEYHYVNRKGERTDIAEIMRGETTDSTFDIILYSTGKRFFGKYQALIHIHLVDSGESGVSYVAAVYAYPENVISRFFARHLGIAEKYFNKKTANMTEMITLISRRLCEDEVEKEEAKKITVSQS